MEQLVKWDRKTMFPHYHLDAHVGLIHAPVTIPNADVSQVFDTARKVAHQRDIPETTLAALGVTHQLLRSEEWRAVSDRLPRCWITKKIEWEPMGTRNLEEIWFPDGLQRDFRESSTIESSNERVRSTESLPDIAVGSCQILEYAAQSIHIRATMQTPGVMILSDVYDNDWRCESRSNADGDWKPLPIMRANRIMRAVLLGPGDHEIRFQYAPHSFYWGAGLSAVSCLGLLILIFQRKNEVQP
jgi:hypothetical protein